MQKVFFYCFIFINTIIFAQQDFSDSWEDFFSYNNVKNFVKVDTKIYAIVDNAVFIYDITTQTNKKISSVNGLSGENTSALFYDKDFNRIVIGYTTGLVEIINENGTIIKANDIERLTGEGSKKINHIFKHNNKLFLSTDFAIVEYDIENLEFGDTFRIGNNSTAEKINQITVFNDTIYAATQHGIYTANVNDPFLIDFNNWQQPQNNFIGNFKTITRFNNNLYCSKDNTFYRLFLPNTLQNVASFSNEILAIKTTNNYLNITTKYKAYIYNDNLQQIAITATTTDFEFELNNSFTDNNNIYLATRNYGILKTDIQENNYTEIHPEGPLSNDIFSIEVKNNNLWVVYGAHNPSYGITFTKKGFSHFNGENWINTLYSDLHAFDLVNIAIDPNHENRVFISSYYSGLFEVIDDEIENNFNSNNSGLESWDSTWHPNATLISSTTFDKNGNLWVANVKTENKIKKYDPNNNWASYNINAAINADSFGLGEIIVDNIGNKWLGSRKFGAIVFNENGEQVKALVSQTDKGDLPSDQVKAIAADRNNRIWIGTDKGLVVFRNAGSIFETDNYNANPIKIQLEGATGEEQAELLLGIQTINTIAIDGADNKWFGTSSSGVLGTNPSGRETLNIFTKDNSPLPSNEILKIRVDNTTGKVYFATTKGIVAFNNNVAPFGQTLDETYAYPNPSTKDNEFITIDGRNGTHLPRGTNVKIVDSAGYLVHETNVVEGAEIKGGKVIWNKTNLAGRKVASGIYIVLLSLPDKSETSITKIAIVN